MFGAVDGEVFPRTKVVGFWGQFLALVVVVVFSTEAERGAELVRAGDSLLADHLRTNGVVGVGGWVPGGW